MKEIDELFNSTDVEQIKENLKKLINKIENQNMKEQDKSLEEIVKKAKKTENDLKNKYKIDDNVYFFPEKISPLALLVEEISNDADNDEDILKILKFNLNNYFCEFTSSEENDFCISVDTLNKVLNALNKECDFFKVLQRKNKNLSIMKFNNRFRKTYSQIINYNSIKNQNFAFHIFYSKPYNDEEDEFTLCLKQFGYLLKSILVGESQKAPDGILEVFETIEIPKIDDESKELTDFFANCFVHYIIEKMELRIKKETKQEIKHLETRDEDVVQKLVNYFDDIFKDLLKENKYTKSVPLFPELEEVIKENKLNFKRLFGRTPSGDDFIEGGILFKDIKREYKLMKRNNLLDNAFLYASDKTGLILTEENQKFISKREVNEFQKYVKEYKQLMKSKIKENECNQLQAVEAINTILDSISRKEISDMNYVLNLFVNFYSQKEQGKDNFVINNIKDFLVYCAYKTSLQLSVLEVLIENEYYDAIMAEIRIIYEILISVIAYKNNPDWFEEKILSVIGLEIGTHRKLSGKDNSVIENIKTGKQYHYKVQKSQLAEKAGEDYKKIYETFYEEMSGFIHLDTKQSKNIFQNNDLFWDIDECLDSGFVGIVFSLEIIMELIDFEGCDKKLSKDIKYFSNKLLKNFLPVLETMNNIENKELYILLKNTLEKYKTDYKINYQRNNKCEIYKNNSG